MSDVHPHAPAASPAAPTPIIVSASAGTIDGAQALLRLIVVVVTAIPLMLKLSLQMKPEARMEVPELLIAVVVDKNVGRPAQQLAQGIPR